MASCSKCNKTAVTYICYNGTHLCHEHFNEYVEKRVKREVRQQLTIYGKRKLGVCISGGKDSAVTLELMVKILGRRKDVEICAITVDEGIWGYRSVTLEKAREQCHRLNVPHHVITFKEVVGMELDDMAPFGSKKTACSYCGVFRRRCLNQKAKDLGLDLLVTGHNLDDTAQSIMMNFTRGDVERLARLGPHIKVQPGLVPRMEPLRSIPEKESLLYAILNDIEHSDEECPYAGEALRNEYRNMIDLLEDGHPGTKHAIVRSYDAIRPALSSTFPPSQLHICACGEPTGSERCMACAMLEEIRKRK